jgi:membrane protein
MLSGMNAFAVDLLPGSDFLFQLLNQVISFAIITLLFGMIFKILPDVEIAWRDVWVGAAMTALLFSIGKYLIGLYLGNSSISSTYGAAGSFAVILVWIFYSAQILLFGAEFTQVYAKRHGSQIRPADNAVAVSDAALVAQGRSPKGKPEAKPPALTGGKAATTQIPSLQPPSTDDAIPSPASAPPALWLAAVGALGVLGGIWLESRRTHIEEQPDQRSS